MSAEKGEFVLVKGGEDTDLDRRDRKPKRCRRKACIATLVVVVIVLMLGAAAGVTW